MDLLTAAEAADRIGMAQRTFRRHARLGNIRYSVKVPGQTGAYLFDPDEVDRFDAERKEVAS